MTGFSHRRLSAVLLIIGMMAIVWGGARLVTNIQATRDQQLDTAQAVVQARLALPMAHHSLAEIRQATAVLVAEPDGAFSYVTVRDEQGQLLASAGSRQGVFAWLPSTLGRSWRAWFYRNLSVRDTVALTTAEDSRGSASLGIAWPEILERSGSGGLVGLLLMLFGGVCSALGLRAWWKAPPTEPTSATPRPSWAAAPARARANAPARPERLANSARPSWQARWQTRRARPSAGDDDFQQIGPSPVKPRASKAVDFPAVGRSSVAEPAPVVGRQTPLSQRAVDDAWSADEGSDTSPLTVEALASMVGRPRQSSVLVLDDTTLDLRFYPIWRGVGRDTLAGGWATLVWRYGSGDIVTPDTLVRMAEQAGRVEDFLRWLAERMTLLQVNWRALELLTVPIVLPVPAALLADDRLRLIWRQALTRAGLGDQDLIFQVGDPASVEMQAWPVRYLVPEAKDVGDGACPLRWRRPGSREDDAGEAEYGAAARPDLVVGPVADPSMLSGLLTETDRVAWFSWAQDDAHLLTPRRFARLVSQQALAPL